MRRSERALGVAIRKGQDAGEILPDKVSAARPGQHRVDNAMLRDYVGRDEWRGNGAGIKQMTDEVSDEQFEEALADARFEENMSRATPTVLKRRKAPCSVPKDEAGGTFSKQSSPNHVGLGSTQGDTK